MAKYYVVLKGKVTGIFDSWDIVNEYVSGYKSALYKSFKTLKEAQAYWDSYHIQVNGNIHIYTDGSCKNGKGGYAAIVTDGNQIINKYYGPVNLNCCTNNRAELYAIIKAMELCNEQHVTIHTDSLYCINVLSMYDPNKDVNGDLILKYFDIKSDRSVKFIHVKGHNGDEFNEMADRLANFGVSSS